VAAALASLLNQYTQRDVSSGVDIMGYAPAGTVTMTNNGNTQTAYRFAGFFQSLWTWANTAAAQYQAVNILLDGNAFDGRTVFIPRTPEQFSYDADGNLLADGRWDYTWNGENQLIAMQTRYGLPAAVPIIRLEFSYDDPSRRIPGPGRKGRRPPPPAVVVPGPRPRAPTAPRRPSGRG